MIVCLIHVTSFAEVLPLKGMFEVVKVHSQAFSRFLAIIFMFISVVLRLVCSLIFGYM